MRRFLNSRVLGLLCLWISMASIAPAAVATPGAAGPDPLEGPWVVYEGVESRSGGFEFGPGIDRRWGQAQFRRMVGRVSFDPDSRETPASMSPSGQYTYRFDPRACSLTLTDEKSQTTTYYLKHKEERLSNLGTETQQMLPFLCIFHDPATRRAFKLIRQDAVGASTGKILIPHDDPLAGTWSLLRGSPSSAMAGYHEFGLISDASPLQPRLTVNPDHSAVMAAGSKSVTFRLRPSDANHWTILSEADPTRPVGTVVIESKASELVGPNIHVTRWLLDGAGGSMTAVLRDQAHRNDLPHVAMIRVEGSQLLTLEALAAKLPGAQ